MTKTIATIALLLMSQSLNASDSYNPEFPLEDIGPAALWSEHYCSTTEYIDPNGAPIQVKLRKFNSDGFLTQVEYYNEQIVAEKPFNTELRSYSANTLDKVGMYDLTGKLQWAIHFTRSREGRMETERVQVSDAPSPDDILTRYSYDDVGRIILMQVGNESQRSSSVELHYLDGKKRPSQIKTVYPGFGAEITKDFFYDEKDRLRKVEEVSMTPQGQYWNSYKLEYVHDTYPGNNDVTQRILSIDPGGRASESRKTYSFDGTGRLTGVFSDWDVDGKTDYEAVYRYDCDAAAP